MSDTCLSLCRCILQLVELSVGTNLASRNYSLGLYECEMHYLRTRLLREDRR